MPMVAGKNLRTMLNFFKKSEPSMMVAEKNHNYPQTVIEIHKEFFTAGDRLLAESELILKECEKFDKTKASDLKELGFTSVKDVISLSQIEISEILAKKQAELVNKYRVEYPNYKFITEEIVKQICLKYSLVCGDVSLYKGFVPKNNIEQLKAFKQKNKFPNLMKFSFDDKMEIINMDNYERFENENYIYFKEKITNNFGFQQDKKAYDGVNFYGIAKTSDGRYVHGRQKLLTMQICAPLKDMNTEGMELKGYRLEKHIPDPVVLQPVEGGYLIVTAWGDESSDELVVNQQMN